jgi:eukaryotic translation initiation factor 2C
MVWDRLWDWYDAHAGKYPDNILYFRDGVADSQYAAVKETELIKIRKAFNEFYVDAEKKVKEQQEKQQKAGNKSKGKGKAKEEEKKEAPQVKITAVICTKRHHTRFYPIKEADKQTTNGQSNCKPGLLVDGAITHPFYTDLYLQSHNGQKGTAKAAHYFILTNEMGISVDHLQHLVSPPPPPHPA